MRIHIKTKKIQFLTPKLITIGVKLRYKRKTEDATYYRVGDIATVTGLYNGSREGKGFYTDGNRGWTYDRMNEFWEWVN